MSWFDGDENRREGSGRDNTPAGVAARVDAQRRDYKSLIAALAGAGVSEAQYTALHQAVFTLGKLARDDVSCKAMAKSRLADFVASGKADAGKDFFGELKDLSYFLGDITNIERQETNKLLARCALTKAEARLARVLALVE